MKERGEEESGGGKGAGSVSTSGSYEARGGPPQHALLAAAPVKLHDLEGTIVASHPLDSSPPRQLTAQLPSIPSPRQSWWQTG